MIVQAWLIDAVEILLEFTDTRHVNLVGHKISSFEPRENFIWTRSTFMLFLASFPHQK